MGHRSIRFTTVPSTLRRALLLCGIVLVMFSGPLSQRLGDRTRAPSTGPVSVSSSEQMLRDALNLIPGPARIHSSSIRDRVSSPLAGAPTSRSHWMTRCYPELRGTAKPSITRRSVSMRPRMRYPLASLNVSCSKSGAGNLERCACIFIWQA